MAKRHTPADYHEQTKHHYHRMARSLGYLDWATQPDPFRRFAGAPLISLPLDPPPSGRSYDDLYLPPAVDGHPVTVESLSAFFGLALAISAWKQFGQSRWALRVNPSSGNLHPTEGYLVTGPIDGLHDAPAVYHYAPKEHGLERRTEFAASLWSDLMRGLPDGSLLVGLSSIHWREAWKYGERAYRYCQHDVGHALGALSFAAAVQGWQVRPMTGVSDADTAALLGLDRASDFEPGEREHPDLLAVVIPTAMGHDTPIPSGLPGDAIARIAADTWTGRANRLSSDHTDWQIIEETAQACEKSVPHPSGVPEGRGTHAEARETPRAAPDEELSQPPPDVATPFPPYQGGTGGGVFPTNQETAPLAASRSAMPADTIIRQRRSAQAMDGTTSISAEAFFLMFDRTMPRLDRAPFAALGPPTCVHLALFVHRVDGLAPGLFFLCRRPDALDDLKAAMTPSFEWTRPASCPESLPLYLLQTGDFRDMAAQVSCTQDIAGDGAFSLGMIAEFDGTLSRFGPWFYRRLFWETGVIGQVLYLEAEAAGVRGTGIGCFFDDAVHDLLGLTGTAYQSLYHFTIGGPVEDTRITTLPAYFDR